MTRVGFVVARFGLAASMLCLSIIIGVVIVMIGGAMELLALWRFLKIQGRVRSGNYEPGRGPNSY